ncbi:MAG: hypothetical protein H0T47_01475 [Planctomycetaceae bacterium]|nr:hypothetical protein [Planctomycetaceae bacterium]
MERTVGSSYRGLNAEARDDAVAEAVANAFAVFVRLAERDRQDAATATSLARFAVRQYFAGRRVGNRLNANDVLSPYARQKRKFRLARLNAQGGKRIGKTCSLKTVMPHPPILRQVASTFPLGWKDSRAASARSR